MGKKVIRDPNAPKRNLSAYLLYQNAMRNTFKSKHPHMTFGQLSKHTSAMYASLSPTEKADWQLKAEQDKGRYLSQMSQYNPPPGYDARGEAIVSPNANIRGVGGVSAGTYAMSNSMIAGYDQNRLPVKSTKKVKCRDPHAPKRNLSAYLLYQNAMRDQFKNDNPGMTFGQLSKYTSHMYRSLTAQEKAQWESRSIQDKARFTEEMSRYIPPPGFDGQGILIDTHPASTLPSSQTKKVKKPKDPNAPKRARGSYVFFTNYIRPIIMKQNPNTKFVELGAIMGERWRGINPEEKIKYEALANEDRNRFNREMEEYNAKKAESAAAASAAAATTSFTMPQIVDQNQAQYSNHLQMQMQQQQQQQQQQPPLQQSSLQQPSLQQSSQVDENANVMSLLPDQQQQQPHHQFQALHTQSYLPMDAGQVYSNSHFDPNHYQYSSSNQYNHQSHNV